MHATLLYNCVSVLMQLWKNYVVEKRKYYIIIFQTDFTG